jgi:hypothetical protein
MGRVLSPHFGDEIWNKEMAGTGPLLIQVLAQLKPTRCGVSDHAVLLAAELENAYGIGSAFVVLNSDERNSVPWPVIYCAPAQLLASCIELIEGRESAILVHVSGYGYSADGAPKLLADALDEVKKDGRFRIATYFHEISASGPPWTSAFWHARRQKAAIRRIAEASGLVVTNIGAHATWLRREASGGAAHSVKQLPVFSVAGEVSRPVPQSQRRPVMAVFGLPATRKKSYQELAALPDLLKSLGIEEILDIGTVAEAPAVVNGVTVRPRGKVSVEELAEELSRVKCGFLSYNTICLAKSSIFATYCAQGAVPVIAESFDGEIDGLKDGVQLLSPRTVRDADLDRCSLEAWQWYAEHGVHVHAETYAQWMKTSAQAQKLEQMRQ